VFTWDASPLNLFVRYEENEVLLMFLTKRGPFTNDKPATPLNKLKQLRFGRFFVKECNAELDWHCIS
jgi:hypothetical protein